MNRAVKKQIVMRISKILMLSIFLLLLNGLNASAIEAWFCFGNTTLYDATVFLKTDDDFCFGSHSKKLVNENIRHGSGYNTVNWEHLGGAQCGIKGQLEITINKNGVNYLLVIGYTMPEVGSNTFTYENDGPFGVRFHSDKPNPNRTFNHWISFEIFYRDSSNICSKSIALTAITQKAADVNIRTKIGNSKGDIIARDGLEKFGNGFYLITDFPNSDIYYGCRVGKACAIWSDIWNEYHKNTVGAEHGRMGWPVIDETSTPNKKGTYCHFQDGSIYWSPGTGAHAVWGAIRDEWEKTGWENSPIGFPVSDEKPLPDNTGVYQQFEGGLIYFKWLPLKNARPEESNNAHTVRGAILDIYAKQGFEKGKYGFPIGDEASENGKPIQYFENGTIVP